MKYDNTTFILQEAGQYYFAFMSEHLLLNLDLGYFSCQRYRKELFYIIAYQFFLNATHFLSKYSSKSRPLKQPSRGIVTFLYRSKSFFVKDGRKQLPIFFLSFFFVNKRSVETNGSKEPIRSRSRTSAWVFAR